MRSASRSRFSLRSFKADFHWHIRTHIHTHRHTNLTHKIIRVEFNQTTAQLKSKAKRKLKLGTARAKDDEVITTTVASRKQHTGLAYSIFSSLAYYISERFLLTGKLIEQLVGAGV